LTGGWRDAMLTVMDTDCAARCLAELGHPARLEIYRSLVRVGPQGMPVKDLQARLGIPKSTLSHHIAHLVWSGLVTQERDGRMLICRAQFAVMNALVAFLSAECCTGIVCDPCGVAVSAD